MKLKKLVIALIAATALSAAAYGLYALGMQRGMGMSAGAEQRPAQPATEANASQALPQSVAEGEDATRRHIADGLKAGDMDPVTGKKILYYHDPIDRKSVV